MNLSDPSDDDSSGNESPVPISAAAKRLRADTYGASSTTSQGSALQESDDDHQGTTESHSMETKRPKLAAYAARGSASNTRLSQSSLSEHCSSPNDQYDEYRPSLDDNDGESSLSARPSFGADTNDNTFYDINNDASKDIDDAYSVGYSDKSKRMMSNMGFKPGKGLGKYEHGRTEPVEASTQKGRRGLGLKPSIVGEIPKDFKWTPDETKPEAKEEVSWMPSPPEDPPLGDQLEDWLQRGPKKLTIDDETLFVEAHVLKGVLDSKTIFDSLEDEDLRHARFRSNPYETIGSVIFLNRAAVKMANLDAVFDFMFTKPKKPNGESAIDKKEILYFADVCAGPGGFSEYILYRKGWRAKGFGFTLKGGNDFKLSDFYAGTPETFNAFYGVKGDGNVFDPANLSSLKEEVLKQTDDKGVHFLMADGGFSVEGQENIQEILSKQLYLCQCLAALMLVRTGGHFVVKLFDVFTLFSVGLIYIMYRCFEKVSIHKPVTSRPANSERYLVCMWKKMGTESAEQHLFSVNSILWSGLKEDDDVTELVPLSVIQEDEGFFEYIYRSNSILGDKQIRHLLKIAAFSKDKNLKETTQAEMREQCLKLWHLPDKVRTQPERLKPDDTLMNVVSLIEKPPSDAASAQAIKSKILNKPPHYLEKIPDLGVFKNVYDWHYMVLSSAKNSPDLKFFIGCGGKQVYLLDGSSWKSLIDLNITMPAKTLIYGEIVKEYQGSGNNQLFSKSLHIIDGLVLGGIDISHLPLTERANQCAQFSTALEKPFDAQAIPIRCKRLFNMESFPSAINHLEVRAMKRGRRAVTIDTPHRNRNEKYYAVGSMLFIKEINEPWSAQMSKSSGCKYYFCVENKKPRSEYFIPDDARLDMLKGYMGRVMWVWDDVGCAILDGKQYGGLSRSDMEDFIRCNTKR